jgi:hypothetical protein
MENEYKAFPLNVKIVLVHKSSFTKNFVRLNIPTIIREKNWIYIYNKVFVIKF